MTFGEFQENHESTSLIIQLRGLPYNTSKEEIYNFLEIDETNVEECEITCTQEGKPSGEAFLNLTNLSTVTKALQKHKQLYPKTERYVDIYQTNKNLMSKRVTITRQYARSWDGIIKLKNLKPKTDMQTVQKFFKNLTILNNEIFLSKNFDNLNSGECFVQFEKFSDGEKAVEMSGMEIDGNFVEISKSCNNELRSFLLADRKLKYHWSKWGSRMKNGDLNCNVVGNLKNGQICDEGGVIKEIKMDYAYNEYGRKGPGFKLNFDGCKFDGQVNKPKIKTISIPIDETKPTTKIISEKIQNINFKKFIIENEKISTLPNGVPVIKPDPTCEYKNVIILCNITTDIVSEDVKQFLKPSKAIGYLFQRELRQVLVGMESHEDCVFACESKHKKMLKNSKIEMILKSEMMKS